VIYFIQVLPNGPIKIGYTAASTAIGRFNQLQQASPYKLALSGLLHGYEKEERKLHRLFSKYKLRGEWFESAPELVNAANTLIGNWEIKPSLKSNIEEVLLSEDPDLEEIISYISECLGISKKAILIEAARDGLSLFLENNNNNIIYLRRQTPKITADKVQRFRDSLGKLSNAR
jgi:hypothetical protein